MTSVATPAAVVGARRWWVLVALTGANLLVFASVTIMNVALPDARADLALSTGVAQLVVTLYSLTFGSLILLGGRVADVLGLRRCLVGGLAGFAAASLLGGIATGGTVLLVARALQGGTGAFVAATAVSLLSVSFPRGRDRQVAFAVLGIVMGIGTAGSFLLAGVLVDRLSWRWCLLVNVPLALAVAVVILCAVPRVPRREGGRVDLGGAALVCLALGALVSGLDRVARRGWWDEGALTFLASGLLGLGLFVVTLRRSAQPLVPRQLVGDRTRVAAYVAAGFVGVAMFAGMFVLTSYLQEVQGLAPVRIGLAFLPFAGGALVATWLLPAVRTRLPAASTLAAGLALAGAAIATFALLGTGASGVPQVVPAMVLLGAGGTMVMITAGDVATEGAGMDSGVAGSMVNSAQQVGAALGTALLATVMNVATRDAQAAGASAVTATMAGFARAGLVGASMLAAAAVLVWLVCGGHRHRRADRAGRPRRGGAHPGR